MNDGTTHRETVMKPKGDPGNPLSPEEIAEKFRGNCAETLGAAQTEALLMAVRSLPRAPDLGALSELLAPVG